MKILLINKYLYNRGGDFTYIKTLGDLLIQNNHLVNYWGMDHPSNPTYDNDQYFTDYIDYPELMKQKSINSVYKTLKTSIYSKHAKRKLSRFIEKFKPDIVHMGNIHSHLTPSIIDVLNDKKIPIVWTLHDFELLCPNIHFLSNGKICEDCKTNKYYMCSLNKCKKGSFPASVIASIKSYAHYFMNLQTKVDLFITPSQFMKDKFIDFGWDEEKFIYLQNFVHQETVLNSNEKSEKYILYFGGLSPWKGILTLIDSVIDLDDVKLVIVGDGELREKIETKIETINNIEYLGYQESDKLHHTISNAFFAVVPSECYENCPYSILEALSLGVPVIGSNIGGIPELIMNGVNGFLFEKENINDLKDKITTLYSDNKLREKFSYNAIKYIVNNHNSLNYYDEISNVYNKLM